MKNLNFLNDLDYFLDKRSIEILISIVQNDLYEDRKEYDQNDLKDSYQINDDQSNSIFEILQNPDDFLLYEIISRVLEISGISDNDKKDYIFGLFEGFESESYQNISDDDLIKDIQCYLDYQN